MNKQNLSVYNMLDRLQLTASQRVRAEANLRQSEFLVDLMLSAFGAIMSAVNGLRSEANTKPAQRLGTAS